MHNSPNGTMESIWQWYNEKPEFHTTLYTMYPGGKANVVEFFAV